MLSEISQAETDNFAPFASVSIHNKLDKLFLTYNNLAVYIIGFSRSVIILSANNRRFISCLIILIAVIFIWPHYDHWSCNSS